MRHLIAECLEQCKARKVFAVLVPKSDESRIELVRLLLEDALEYAPLQTRHGDVVNHRGMPQAFHRARVKAAQNQIAAGHSVKRDVDGVQKLARRWRVRAAAIRLSPEQDVKRVQANKIRAVGGRRFRKARQILEISNAVVAL